MPASQGGQVQVSGRGFDPGEYVTFTAARGASGVDVLQLGGATASAQGTVDAVALTLPDELMSGPHALEAVGQSGGRRSTGTLWIRARDPWLVLSMYDIQPFVDLGLIAGGFEPQEAVRVTLEAREDQPRTAELAPLADLTTDQAGNGEWTQVKLPLIKPGGYSIVLRGLAGGQELRRNITVDSLHPTAELSPWAGPPGVPVQLNAKGFAPNERVHVAFGGPTATCGGLALSASPRQPSAGRWRS
jgi:hypothetical protein